MVTKQEICSSTGILFMYTCLCILALLHFECLLLSGGFLKTFTYNLVLFTKVFNNTYQKWIILLEEQAIDINK